MLTAAATASPQADALSECHHMWRMMHEFAKDASNTEQRAMVQEALMNIGRVAMEIVNTRLATIRTTLLVAAPAPAPVKAAAIAPAIAPVKNDTKEDRFPFLAAAKAALANPRQWESNEWADPVGYFESIGYWYPLLPPGHDLHRELGVEAARRTCMHAMLLMRHKPNAQGEFLIGDIRKSGLGPGGGIRADQFAKYADRVCCTCCGGVSGNQPAFTLTEVFNAAVCNMGSARPNKETTLAAWVAALPPKVIPVGCNESLYTRWEIETHIAPLVRVMHDQLSVPKPAFPVIGVAPGKVKSMTKHGSTKQLALIAAVQDSGNVVKVQDLPDDTRRTSRPIEADMSFDAATMRQGWAHPTVPVVHDDYTFGIHP